MEKKTLVLGTGVSGIQASNLLLKSGKEVILFDSDESKDVGKIKDQLQGEAEIILGKLPEDISERTDFACISPGISLETPFVEKLMKSGVDIISEIELAWLYEKGQVIGITGTNGKTTTTTLVGDIMKAYAGEDKAFTVGNIGLPYAGEVTKSSEDTISTIELSSFQLETIKTFHPHVSAILNITPDHLNRHHTMEIYTEMKEKVAMNQTEEDYIVLNYDDERLKAFGESGLLPRVIWFSGTQKLKDGYYLQGDDLCFSENGVSEVLFTKQDVNLVGQCNYENILAAIAIADAFGVPRDISVPVIKNFKAVAHRIEFVREVNGVRYYDDSKGTNVDAAVQGIRAMTTKTILIGGGYDKEVEFDDWVVEFKDKVKKLLLLGQTREKIAETCEKHGFKRYEFVESLEEAVFTAASEAVPGEAVLLSPACASWGMFKNFEERGDIFKALVNSLE